MLWPIDKLFIAYAVLMVCLLAIAVRHDSFAFVLILGHVAAISLLLALYKYPSELTRFLSDWYLLVYLPFCYKQVPYLVSMLNLSPVDSKLAHWDLVMWHVDPIFWLSSMRTPLVVEFLQVIYSMFLPGMLALGVILWLTRSRQEFRYGTFVIAATFLVSYLGYLLMPARGPRFMAYASHYPPLQGLWTFHFLQNALNTLEGMQYDCFPSGHVAVLVVGCYVARKISAPVFYIFSAFAALITVSTVYLRYHYAIDVIAGMLLAIVIIASAPRLYRILASDKNLSFVPGSS
jgi:membrane-associated phospholipid phosphatase